MPTTPKSLEKFHSPQSRASGGQHLGARLWAAFLPPLSPGLTTRSCSRTRREGYRAAGEANDARHRAPHRGTRVILIADNTTITVVRLNTGEIIATNTINPSKTYWRNNEKEPGRWPGSHS